MERKVSPPAHGPLIPRGYACRAIIQSGPRRGHRCGRACWGGKRFCVQYHYRLEEEPRQEPIIPEVRIPDLQPHVIPEVRIPDLPRPLPVQLPHVIPEVRIPQPELLRPPPPRIIPRQEPVEDIIHLTEHRKNLVLQELDRLANPNKPFFRFCDNDADIENHTDDCPICTCQPSPKEKWVRLPCTHSFHNLCIREWVGSFAQRDKGCPMCRQAFTPLYESIEGFRT